MMTIKRYSPELKPQWDAFVNGSKNGTFLMCRDYMDYHSDRFDDFSLMLYKDDHLSGLLVASIHDGGQTIKCHGGLTYGGLIVGMKATLEDVSSMCRTIRDYLKANGVGEMIYKPVPHIYHSLPSEEDLYLLFAEYKAILTRRDISSVVDFDADTVLKVRRIRECGRRTALKNKVTTSVSTDYERFWDILNSTLQCRHRVRPVHTKEELRLLADRFPDNIKLVAAFDQNGNMIAGTVLYLTPTCIHSQYIAASEDGRKVCALDMMFIDILSSKFEIISGQRYFDFGRSTEADGSTYNQTLIYQKEGFGARGVCYDTYSIRI